MKPFQFHSILTPFPLATTKLGKEWESIQQLGLSDPNGDDGANSKIKYVGIATYQDYFKFAVRHETIKECWIRVAREDWAGTLEENSREGLHLSILAQGGRFTKIKRRKPPSCSWGVVSGSGDG